MIPPRAWDVLAAVVLSGSSSRLLGNGLDRAALLIRRQLWNDLGAGELSLHANILVHLIYVRIPFRHRSMLSEADTRCVGLSNGLC
jgi:hypothetical protein